MSVDVRNGRLRRLLQLGRNSIGLHAGARRIIVGVSLVFITFGQLLPTGGIQELLTDTGFIGLVAGALLLFQNVEVDYRSSSEIKVSSVTTWRWTLAGLGILGILCIQRWFIVGTTNAGGDIGPPYGVAWISKLFQSFSWTGSNLGGPANNQAQLPWAAVAWTIHQLGGSGALAQRVWFSLLVAAIFVSAGALARALQFSPLAGFTLATLYFFNPTTMSFVGDNTVFLVAMILVPTLASVVISYGASRARLWHVVMVFVVSAPFVGFAYNNPPIVLMVVLTTVATPLLVWAQYGRRFALRAARGLAIGGILLAGVSAYWLVPALSSLGTVATSNLSTLSGWAFTEARSTLSNGLWLNTIWGWSFSTYYPFANDFSRFPLDLVVALVPLSAFAVLSLRRITTWSSLRAARLMGTIALLSLGVVLFSTGTKSPGNIIFDPFYHIKFGWLLREPGRFLIAAGLGYAILNGFLVEHFRDRRLPRSIGSLALRPWIPKLPVSSLIAVALVACGVAASFPLLTGASFPGAHDGFPSTHVVFPNYWSTTAEYLNSSQAPRGALMVLPADDFYQMPYTWYYGNDGFITNLMARKVVVPSAQGYGLVSGELLSAVQLESSSILKGNWKEAGRALNAVGTPVVLVRGDIDASFPGRTIASPAKLASALSRDPEMEIVYNNGPLSLFELRPEFRSAFSNFATVNTSSPRLSELAMLSPGTALVSSRPVDGHISITELPRFSKWNESSSLLTTSLHLASNRRYTVAGSKSKTTVGITLSGGQSGGLEAKVTIPIGTNLLNDGNFSNGLWGPVANCNNANSVKSTDTFSALRIRGLRTQPRYALQLSASVDSACESRSINWQKGNLLVSFDVRTLGGSAPRICVWQEPLGTCAASPSLASKRSWHRVTMTVQPSRGTKAIELFLYADSNGSSTPSVEQYANLGIHQTPVEKSPILVGTPPTLTHGGLVTYATGYSTSWVSATSARHVIVNGLTNGWIISSAHAGAIKPRNTITSVEGEKEITLFLLSLVAAYCVWFLTRRKFEI